jgi:hypothetical protein
MRCKLLMERRNPDTLPKNGSSAFKPIRINYLLLNSSIKSDYQSPFSTEKFLRFKELFIDPVNKFFTNFLKVFPLENFEDFDQRINTYDADAQIFNVKNVSKYLKGYVINFFLFLLFYLLQKNLGLCILPLFQTSRRND